MTGRERSLAALQRQVPDRIPTFEWIIHPNIMEALTGQRDEIEFVKRMDIDGISVGLNEKKTTVDDRHYMDEWGIVRVSYDEYPNPVGFPVKEASDLKKLNVPDPDADYRYDKIVRAQKELGREKAIIARVRDVVSAPRDLLGFENYLLSFYTQPDVILALEEICVDYSGRIAKNLKELGIEVVVVGDDIATNSGLMMSPAMYREMVYPYFKKLMGILKENGLYIIKHSDGDLHLVLEDLADSGIDCLDPIDPLGNMQMADIKAKVGHKLALKGNICCVHTLVEKTAEEVENEVKQCILDGGQDGGLIVSSSNSIHSGVKPENYKTMLDAIKTYGKYPLDIQLLNERK